MAKAPIGYFAFVFHSHLPYVLGHGRWPHGTDWLNEATAETYIPLLDILNELVDAGISPKITVNISPVLAEQLSDPELKPEFEDYVKTKIESAIADQSKFGAYHRSNLAQLAEFWQQFYKRTLDHFQNKYNSDLIAGFRKLQDAGHIEIITCAATHGYLPLLSQDTSIQAQVKCAIATHTRHFGKAPRGIWLPECAYRPRYMWTPPVGSAAGKRPYMRKGVEEFLSENGLDFFVIDSHLLKGGKAIGVYLQRFEALKKLWGVFTSQYQVLPEDEEKTPYAAYLVSSYPDKKKPVAVLTRDPKTGVQVWSGEWGYPGDGNYLDFHKKHFPGGHRYWKVTHAKADLADKQEYDPLAAMKRIPENADHFVKLLQNLLIKEYERTGKPGILCSPFDTELFGHWWFEGPQWVKQVLKRITETSEETGVYLTTSSEYLDLVKPQTVISIPEGSWGEGGFHYIWLNEWNTWTWKHIYDAEVEMQDLLEIYSRTQRPALEEVLKQAARELLLLQSSDWQFLISTWSARDYAEMRVSEHYSNFSRLRDLAIRIGEGESIDSGEWIFLQDCQKQNRLFPEIDLSWFKKVEFPA